MFIPTLTPREHLRFHANMRMDASLSEEDKMQAVENALEGLGLGELPHPPLRWKMSRLPIEIVCLNIDTPAWRVALIRMAVILPEKMPAERTHRR